jgi:hypothetical protein
LALLARRIPQMKEKPADNSVPPPISELTPCRQVGKEEGVGLSG